jgi:hypothetical protein
MWNTDGYWYPPVISLSGPTGTVFQAKGNPYFTTAFSTQGLLQSGEYVLSAQAQGVFYHFDGATFNLSFAVVPIPEPATWALLALSVGALLGILGRQQRQDRARLPTVGKTDTMVTPTG